ncbi:MAG TPA: LytR C-terminal domain-containing protein, partial [Chitinivibrionales bacterium]
PTANYPSTLVVSRTKDMSVARQIAAALGTEKVVLMRTGDETYDVTVFIGPDYPERTTRK